MGKIKIRNIKKKKRAIKELFNEPHRSHPHSRLFDEGLDQGIIAVLDILGIKIRGVND